jgi:hypothetical protein
LPGRFVLDTLDLLSSRLSQGYKPCWSITGISNNWISSALWGSVTPRKLLSAGSQALLEHYFHFE